MESCTIHFKDKLLSLFDVFNKRTELVELTLDSKIVSDYDSILRRDLKLEWWHQTYCTLRNIQLPECQYVLRVTFKPEMLYSYHISLEAIAEKIRHESDATNKIVVVPSYFSLGIIDIFPIDDNITETLGIGDVNGVTKDNKASLFINTLIYSFPHIHIKGINKIERMIPEKISLTKVINEQHRIAISPDKKKVKWDIILSSLKMKITGVSLINFKHLFKLTVGLFHKKTTYLDNNPVLTVMIDLTAFPADMDVTEKTKPFEIISILYDKEDKEIREAEIEARKQKQLLIIEGSDFYKANNYYYATALSFSKKGSSGRDSSSPFISLMARDDIDQRYTICNNVRDVNKYLGVEAARMHHILSFTELGADTDIRHIILLVDFMSNMGEILPITFTGLQRQRMGPLDKATHEKSMDSFRDGAGMGVREEIKSISSEIAVGKRIGAGTGHMGIKIDDEMFAKYQHMYENAPAKLERVHLADEAARANVLIDTFKVELFNEPTLDIPLDIPLPENEDDGLFGGIPGTSTAVSSMLTQSSKHLVMPLIKTEETQTSKISTNSNVVVVLKRSEMPNKPTPEVVRTTLGIPPIVANIFSIPITDVYEQTDPDMQLPPLKKLEPPVKKMGKPYNGKNFIANMNKLNKLNK